MGGRTFVPLPPASLLYLGFGTSSPGRGVVYPGSPLSVFLVRFFAYSASASVAAGLPISSLFVKCCDVRFAWYARGSP